MVSPGDVLLVGGGCVLELLGPGVRVVVILVPPRRACSVVGGGHNQIVDVLLTRVEHLPGAEGEVAVLHEVLGHGDQVHLITSLDTRHWPPWCPPPGPCSPGRCPC